jgi:hypothetical protein
VPSFADINFLIFNDIDRTKALRVDMSGASASTFLSLAVSNTANRTITFPDATGTLVLKESAEEITGAWSFNDDDGLLITTSGAGPAALSSDGLTASRLIKFPDADCTLMAINAAQTVSAQHTFTGDPIFSGSTGTVVAIFRDTTFGTNGSWTLPVMTANRAWSLPDASGQVVLNIAAQALTSKTISSSTIASSTTITLNDSTATVVDGGDVTKKMAWQCSGITTSTTRTHTIQDIDMSLAGSVGTLVELSGQTAAIGATDFVTAPPTGAYLVTVSVECTTASGAGSPTLDVVIGWTNRVGATTKTVISGFDLSATGEDDGVVNFRVNSGNINYTTTIAGAAGTPQYALTIRAVALD